MITVWRIQPAGLPVAGHRSEDSAGERLHLHVFASEVELFGSDVGAQRYGDEVEEVWGAGACPLVGQAGGQLIDDWLTG